MMYKHKFDKYYKKIINIKNIRRNKNKSTIVTGKRKASFYFDNPVDKTNCKIIFIENNTALHYFFLF